MCVDYVYVLKMVNKFVCYIWKNDLLFNYGKKICGLKLHVFFHWSGFFSVCLCNLTFFGYISLCPPLTDRSMGVLR